MTETNVDGFWLPREDQEKLVAILATIPSLVEDLSVSLTRQDRIGSGMRIRSGSDEQPLPIGLTAMEAADELHDELVRWVRLVCEQRAYPYPGNDTLTLARWLKHKVIALALTEGADEALHDINLVVHNARAAVDRPQERIRHIDDTAVHEAGNSLITAMGIERIADALGHPGLTMRRILRLVDAKKLTAVVQASDGSDMYRIADVIAAHLAHPTRQRKAA